MENRVSFKIEVSLIELNMIIRSLAIASKDFYSDTEFPEYKELSEELKQIVPEK